MHTYTAPATVDRSRNSSPEKQPLTAHSRGRGWDCVRQMQMFRHRPEVLAAALRDMGFSDSGDEVLADCHQPHGQSADDQHSDN